MTTRLEPGRLELDEATLVDPSAEATGRGVWAYGHHTGEAFVVDVDQRVQHMATTHVATGMGAVCGLVFREISDQEAARILARGRRRASFEYCWCIDFANQPPIKNEPPRRLIPLIEKLRQAQ